MGGTPEQSKRNAVEATRDHYVKWIDTLSDGQRQHPDRLATYIKENRIDVQDPSTLPTELTMGGVAKGIL
ncbi:MAG: hypothetical protein ACD_57C00278G0001 [uncultured bacterium]|uniref:Uncharacterized protein n=2 Tax=Candidatus Curtissiibacteriota TaxID=1752717 RepID=A0A1F5H4E2_9BACT|nr:MAG: hypothetical protein ACD_57C00278G0001 [uncultured bacterium]OGD91661.1 MAG: hypothetical protein A3D07_03575 [Candidatus Curtissbacteria bacterium RIFCSPHIGHO2_02_FULL_42_15]OGD98917.1 MAG: hypothetical protein A2W45_02000 [Candidatus Curtissbacteria bacterium RIFCSPHIGHO2_12_41_11]